MHLTLHHWKSLNWLQWIQETYKLKVINIWSLNWIYAILCQSVYRHVLNYTWLRCLNKAVTDNPCLAVISSCSSETVHKLMKWLYNILCLFSSQLREPENVYIKKFDFNSSTSKQLCFQNTSIVYFKVVFACITCLCFLFLLCKRQYWVTKRIPIVINLLFLECNTSTVMFSKIAH